MSKNMPNITASTIDAFTALSAAVQKLDEKIYQQIERVEAGAVGIHCFIKKSWDEQPRVYLPRNTTQISYFEDYIGVYCGEYFFKLPDIKTQYSYLFI